MPHTDEAEIANKSWRRVGWGVFIFLAGFHFVLALFAAKPAACVFRVDNVVAPFFFFWIGLTVVNLWTAWLDLEFKSFPFWSLFYMAFLGDTFLLCGAECD